LESNYLLATEVFSFVRLLSGTARFEWLSSEMSRRRRSLHGTAFSVFAQRIALDFGSSDLPFI
jgi:hypothetical protein